MLASSQPQLVSDREGLPARLREPNELRAMFDTQRHRLLEEQIAAGFEHVARDGEVQVGRQDDVDEVQVLPRKHRAVVGVNPCVRAIRPGPRLAFH